MSLRPAATSLLLDLTVNSGGLSAAVGYLEQESVNGSADLQGRLDAPSVTTMLDIGGLVSELDFQSELQCE